MADLNKFRNSKFRKKFKLSKDDIDLIIAKGIGVIFSHTKEIITSRLAPAFPDRDGKQTPFKGHPVFKAQHATATCCRGCLETWHRIKKGRELTQSEIDYVVDYIMTWINDQIKNPPREIKKEGGQLSLF